MSEPTYRQARIHDAEAIAAVINTVVQEPNPVGFEGPTTEEQVRTWLTRQGGEGGIFLCLIENEVIGFARQRLAAHKVPRIVEFVESIPRSPTGMRIRRLLSRRIESEGGPPPFG